MRFKTPFHHIDVHTRHAATEHKPWNWKTPLKLGDTIYLWMAAFGYYSKKTVTEFVRASNFDGSPGALFFISDDNVAYTVSQHNNHVIKRESGDWVYAKTGKEAEEYARRYDVVNKSA